MNSSFFWRGWCPASIFDEHLCIDGRREFAHSWQSSRSWEQKRGTHTLVRGQKMHKMAIIENAYALPPAITSKNAAPAWENLTPSQGWRKLINYFTQTTAFFQRICCKSLVPYGESKEHFFLLLFIFCLTSRVVRLHANFLRLWARGLG